MSTIETKMPTAAVGYIRMSSDMQEKSPEQQREQILRLATKLRCKVVRWYHDFGISGDDTRRRVAFRQMIADATARRDFTVILCWSQDRFGRFDSIEAGEWVAPLRRAGVRLITVAEGEVNWNDTAGRLVYTIQQEGKNTFLLDLARNTTRGRYLGARQIGCYSGPIPYGYDKLVFDERGRLHRRLTRADKFRKPRDWSARLVVSGDSVSRKTVQWIFRAYARGLSIRGITHQLNERSIASPSNKHWRRMSVRSILSNPVYTGDQVWNRLHTGKYFCVRDGEVTSESAIIQRRHEQSGVRKNREEDWVVVKNAHPALVSRELFQQVQARIGQRKGRAYQQGGLALTGLVRCGHCRGKMGSKPFRQVYKNHTYFYRKLVCEASCAQGNAVCRSGMIDEPRLLDFVVAVLRTQVIDEQFEARLRTRVRSELQGGQRHTRTQVGGIRRKIEQLDKTIDRGTENLLRAEPNQIQLAVAKLSHWQTKRDSLAALLAKMEAADPANVNALVADTMRNVRRLRFGLLGEDQGLLHQTLQQLIKQITLWFESNPKRRNSVRLSKGLMELRVPTCDSGVIDQVIDFTAADLGPRRPPGELGWRALATARRSGHDLSVESRNSPEKQSGVPAGLLISHHNRGAANPPHLA